LEDEVVEGHDSWSVSRRLSRRFIQLRFNRDLKSVLGGILIKANRGARTDSLLNLITILIGLER
jgi:hypothetical protein